MVWLYSGGKAAPSWSRDSLHSLYHYMRCSQLENQGHEACTSIQVHTVHTVHSLYHYTFLVSFTVFLVRPVDSPSWIQNTFLNPRRFHYFEASPSLDYTVVIYNEKIQ